MEDILAVIDILFVPVLVLLVAVVVRVSRQRSTTLVLKKFSLAATPLPTPEPTVSIVGRMEGVIAFLLSISGFSPITRFTIAGTELRCQSTSLSGQRAQFIPLSCVSNVSAGVHKPISSLLWAGVFTFGGIYYSLHERSWAPLATSLLFAITFVAHYFLSKKFFIEVHSNGGPPIALLFTPNVIEGVPINVDKALEVAAVIRDMVLSQGRTIGVVDPPEELESETPTEYVPDEQPFETSQVPEPTHETEYNEDYERSAERLYREARDMAQSGQRNRAISVLKEVVRQFPGSQASKLALRALEQAGG